MKVIREAYRQGDAWPYFVTLERDDGVRGYYLADIDALMELADTFQHHADNAAGHSTYAARFDFYEYARRIRDALGVSE